MYIFVTNKLNSSGAPKFSIRQILILRKISFMKLLDLIFFNIESYRLCYVNGSLKENYTSSLSAHFTFTPHHSLLHV